MRVQTLKGNVAVSNLPEGFSAGELAALFDEYGLVLGATVTAWSHKPGMRGTVALAPETAVKAAIESLHGRVLGEAKLSVKLLPPDPPKKKKVGVRPASMSAPQRTSSKDPERIAEAIRNFRANAELQAGTEHRAPPEYRSFSSEGPTPMSLSPQAPVRKPIIEYRSSGRRFTIPPKVPASGTGETK